MAHYSYQGTSGGKLGVWKMGVDEWTSLGDKYGGEYNDIAYHNGKFYASVFTGETIAFDPSSLHLSDVAPHINNSVRYEDLVDSLGDLFAVGYCHRASADRQVEPYFEVCKLNEDKTEWIRVFDLEDEVIFTGDDSSYTVSATDFASLKGKGNPILFFD